MALSTLLPSSLSLSTIITISLPSASLHKWDRITGAFKEPGTEQTLSFFRCYSLFCRIPFCLNIGKEEGRGKGEGGWGNLKAWDWEGVVLLLYCIALEVYLLFCSE
jgi:hypothetical protein